MSAELDAVPSPATLRQMAREMSVAMTARKPKPAPTIAERVAKRFAALMCAQLGAMKLLEIDFRNAVERNPEVCHSHDFIDANVVMYDAMRHEGVSTWLQDEAAMAIWNNAWNLVKECGFAVMAREG